MPVLQDKVFNSEMIDLHQKQSINEAFSSTGTNADYLDIMVMSFVSFEGTNNIWSVSVQTRLS